MTHALLINDDAEYALLIRGHYGGVEMSVEVIHKSDREDKQRAETLTLVAFLLEWCEEQGIEIKDGRMVRYAR